MDGTIIDAFRHCLLNLLVVLLVGGFAIVLATSLYRLLFHPLARYPGPLIARLTDWYSVYRAWEGKRHLDFYQLHQKYGPVVRYGPNSLSISSPAALSAIYGFRANVQKAQFYSAFPATKGSWSTHSAIDKSLHARKRRVLSQGFSDAAMRGLESHILSVIRTFCDAIGDAGGSSRGWSVPKDMGRWANYMSYDVLGDICYGESFGTLEKPDNRFALDLVSTSSQFHYLNAQMPGLKRFGLDRILFPDLRAKRSRFMAYSRARLSNRMAMGTKGNRRDFFYFLLNAKDPETGKGFATEELWGESNVLLIAGSDTTSTAFSATMFHLLHNPTYLVRLTDLVRKTFSSLEEIVSGPTLSSTKYIRACIDEAMRLSPPVPGLLPREVVGPENLTVRIDQHTTSRGKTADTDGTTLDIPPGTVVGVPIFAVHRDPVCFPAPHSYRPERWLQDPTPDDSSPAAGYLQTESELGAFADPSLRAASAAARSAFCPFSVGPRGCIGKGVAYLELSLALARMLWLYDIRLAPGTEEVGASKAKDGSMDRNGTLDYELRDIFVAKKAGPVVQFRRRTESLM